MASAVHAASSTYPPPSFSQNSIDSSMNGMHLSQPHMSSFEAAQSIASTPTVTPPASRGHQHILPLNMPNYGLTNGNHFPQPNSRGPGEMNGHVLQQRYPPGHKPQIYTAIYSGVSVYEMEVNTIIVMRRRLDSWLNATQILKVAGIEKGKRTKVLEKEILAGEHEKVQGGYGKYQGTWINYARGVEFCRQYGVEEILRPLLEYDMGQDGLTTAGQGNIDTPTKEQAMAAQRKRNMLSGGIEQRPTANSSNGTFFKNISKTAANAVNAISKARLDSPGPRPASGNRRPMLSRPPSQQMMGSQESAYQGSSQQSMQSVQSESAFGPNSHIDPALRSQNMPYYLEVGKNSQNGEAQEPPRKRARPSSSQDPLPYGASFDTSMRDLTPTEPSQSFAYQQQGGSQLSIDLTMNGLPPLPQPTSNQDIEKQQSLTSLFLDPSQTDFSTHPALLNLSGEDLDIPIDATAHTALHWAATLARTSLLRALISKGASIFRLNGGGETALIRAALTTNNLDQGSFPELLELLGPTIEIRDGRDRTVLHHIAVSSAVKGRSAACRYYLESLLEFVVRQGSAASSQQISFNNAADSLALPIRSIGLARFMSEIVNATDMSGDTALNLAARIGNKSIIHQLLEVGANPAIANRGGLKPVDFGVGDPETSEAQPSDQVPKMDRDPVSKVTQSSQELVTSISKLVNDASSSFKSEMQSKQSLIDQTHAKIRETSVLLAAERRRIADEQRKASERKSRLQKNANLRRANEELRQELASMSGSASPLDFRTDIKIGEADAGLEVDLARLPELPLPGQPLKMTPAQREYLDSLPPTEVLLARTAAYKKNNERLEAKIKSLHGQSSVLEGQMRRIVSICTGLSEEKVDEMVEGLVAAVESERGEDLDIVRVREFLRKVEQKGAD